MRRTTTEEFDADGHLLKRTVVEDSVDPVVLPTPAPQPNIYPYSPNIWQSPVTVGRCKACAHSGICNCVNPPGGTQITRGVSN